MSRSKVLLVAVVIAVLAGGAGASLAATGGRAQQAPAPEPQALGPTTSHDLEFVPVDPCRLADTAWPVGSSPANGAELPRHRERRLHRPGRHLRRLRRARRQLAAELTIIIGRRHGPGLPAGVPVRRGADGDDPAYQNGPNLLNTGTVALCEGTCAADLSIKSFQASTQVIIDVNGYYIPNRFAGRPRWHARRRRPRRTPLTWMLASTRSPSTRSSKTARSLPARATAPTRRTCGPESRCRPGDRRASTSRTRRTPRAAGQRVLPAPSASSDKVPAALRARPGPGGDPKLAPGSRSHASPGRGLPRPPRTRPRPSCGGGRARRAPSRIALAHEPDESGVDVVGEGLRCLRPRDLGHARGVQDVERERHVEAVDRPVVGRRPGERVHPRRLAGPGPRAAESDRTSLEHGRGEAAAEDLPSAPSLAARQAATPASSRPSRRNRPVDRPVVDGACPGGGEVAASPAVNPSSGTSRRRPRAITA